MKTSTLAIALIVLHLFTSLVRADLVMVQATLAGAAKTPMHTTMYIKGNKMRTDNDTTSSAIIDTATGDMTILVHEQKMVIKKNTKELAALASPAPKVEIPVTKLTATGQMEKVDAYECEIYLSENAGTVVKMWICKNYPGYDKLKEALKPMTQMGAPDALKSPEVPGMMIKSEYEQQGLKFTTKLVSLKEQPVSDDLFIVPADYKAPGLE